jgi:hypothetical protein
MANVSLISFFIFIGYIKRLKMRSRKRLLYKPMVKYEDILKREMEKKNSESQPALTNF